MPEGDFERLTAGLWRVTRAVDSAEAFVERRGSEQAFWSRLERLVTFPACVDFQPFGATSAWSVKLANEDPRKQPAARRRFHAELSQRETALRGDGASAGERSGGRSRRLEQATTSADSAQSVPELGLTSRASRWRPETPSPAVSDGVPAGLSRLRELVGALEARHVAGHSGESTHRSAQVAAGLRAESAKRPLPSLSSPELASHAGPPASTGALRRAKHPAGAVPVLSMSLLEEYAASLAPGSRESSSPRAVESAVVGGDSAAPSGSSPAKPVPRAASLLLGEAPSASSSRPASELDAPERASGPEAALESGAGSEAGAEDDGLLERLNQALVEQAWLRGVDLT